MQTEEQEKKWGRPGNEASIHERTVWVSTLE